MQPVLLSLVLNSTRDGELDGYKENDVWFENAQGGQLLKSHWPIGLLYDYYHATQHHSLPNPPTTPSTSDPPPSSLTSIFAPLGSPSLLSPPRDFTSPPPPPHDPNSTLRGGGSSSNHPSRTSSNSRSTSTSSSSNVRVAHPHPQLLSSSTLTTTLTPWHLILHLSPPTSPSPFVSDFEFNSPSLTECKKSFMARYKEGDYVRFGNSKKRLVNLKREEQDQLWDGVVQNDFQKYWSIANKLIPLPLSTSSPPQPSPSPSIYSGAGQNESTLTVNNAITGDLRNLAVKVYLPPTLVVGGSATGEGGNGTSGATGMGGRILTCPVTPLDANGQPTTLHSYLSSLLPLLFPAQTPLSSTSSTSTFTSSQNHRRTTTKVTAYPLIQGIVVPLESELNWLASCMGGTDGWVSVVVAVFEEELTEGQD
ncbi:hypothetical protein JCM16303_005900 [Sporobolomyces ruberrimus]